MTKAGEMRAGDRMRATYDFLPVDHLHRQEFYIWDEALERWKAEGLPHDWEETNLFQFDPPAIFDTGVELGWCEPPFVPAFEQKVIETDEDYEIVQDVAGRLVRVFRGRRHGFMPEYLKHPVSKMADWEAVAPRLDPDDPARWDVHTDGICAYQVEAIQRPLETAGRTGSSVWESLAAQRSAADSIGGVLTQRVIGGYMYLRALMGPEDVMFMLYDQPEVVHAAMRGWLRLVDVTLAQVQERVEIDEVFICEDICYNHGLLISPDSVREFLMPYYQQVLTNARRRQTRRIYLKVDSDGDCRPLIPIYAELGLSVMVPCEVAAGCDVVEMAKQYPNLVFAGGIDKRVLAAGTDAIEAHLRHILPFMVDRGGYFPMCDHGVPDNVSFEDYLYYRHRVCDLDHK